MSVLRFGLVLLLVSGCAPCEGPEALLDGTWTLQNRVQTVTGENLDAFPAGASPAIGEEVWELDWSDSAFTITIDEQPYAALATWDGVECGFFAVEMSGTYLSPALSTHEFQMGGGFIAYADTLEGEMSWVEEWSNGDEAGTFEGTIVVAGSRAR